MSIPDHPYRPLIEKVSAETPPVPPDVLEAMMIVESGGDPKARSKSDARGLLQLIPRWHASGVGVTVARWLGKPLTDDIWYDPQFNVRAGALHLRWCYTSDGSRSWERAVRKYHSGSADPPSGFVDGQGTSSDQHITKFRAALADVQKARGTKEDTDMALNFDPSLVPFPPYEHRWALNKKDGHGQDDLGTRVHRGIAWHRGVTGSQTLDAAVGYLIAPSTAGLTDGYIDNNTGRLVMMNPMKAMFSDLPAWWEDRAGWANGPYGGFPFNEAVVSADGKAFRHKYGGRLGANITNQDLESFEVLGNYTTSISDRCKRTIVQIQANRAQIKKIPWDSYPINPATGLTEIYGHREFCGTGYKECPGKVVWDFINGEGIVMTREVLKKAQTAGTAVKPAPVVPPPSPEVVKPTPDINLMAELFGGVDGFAFDPKGVVTAAWLEEGEKTGLFPRLVDTVTEGNVRNFVFSNGLVLQNEIGTGKIVRLVAA